MFKHLFSYHEISRMPTYGCRLQHKAYSCRRNFEWKRKRAFSERFYISCLPSMYNFSGSKYDFSFQVWKKEIEKGRRWKRVLIIHFQAKYVFERRFTAKHLTMFGFFLTYSQSVRAKKKREKKQKKEKHVLVSKSSFLCTQYVQNAKCYRRGNPKLNLLCAYQYAVVCSSRSARTGRPVEYPNMCREFPAVPVPVQFHCWSIFKSPTFSVRR